MALTALLLIFLPSSLNGQWGWGNGYNGGYGPPPAPVPNNNLGIGYPTAYGLMLGRPNNGNGWDGGAPAPPGHGTGFGSPLRCLNGGAHIGQCRLDKDSICIALGGTCIHGACCTTPFIGLGTTTTSAPAIEGEVTVKTTTRSTPTTVQPVPETESEEDEVAELKSLISKARSTTEVSVVEEVTAFPEIDHTKQCTSGLRAVGPCGEDSDCPSLHLCERNKCCYIV